MGFFNDLFGATLSGGLSLALKNGGVKDALGGGKPIDPLRGGDVSTDLSPLRTALGNYKPPAPVKTQTLDANQRDLSAIPEYQQLSTRTEQSYNKSAQGSNEALQRRFAAMGGLNSGAYIKQAELQQQQNQEAKSNAMNDLGAKFAGEERHRVEHANEFNATATNQANQFNAGLEHQGQAFQFEGNAKIAGLEQQQKALEQQQRESEFNAAMQQHQARHSGGLLGAGGFLGAGIGA